MTKIILSYHTKYRVQWFIKGKLSQSFFEQNATITVNLQLVVTSSERTQKGFEYI